MLNGSSLLLSLHTTLDKYLLFPVALSFKSTNNKPIQSFKFLPDLAFDIKTMNLKVRGGVHHQEDEEEPWSRSSSSAGSSPASTPRKLKKSSFSFKKNKKDDKNPFATRGLDKFSALLADLEEKRQKIYSRNGSQDISLVRFMYSDSNDCVPIVVKAKKGKDKPKTQESTIKSLPSEQREVVKQQINPLEEVLGSDKKKEEKEEKKKKSSFSLDMMLSRLRRPSYYLPVVIVLILMLLALSGRSFAIMCTCIGWYIIPTLTKGTSSSSSSSTVKNPMKKKEYVRRFSEVKNGSSSQMSHGNSGPVKDKSPPQPRGHRNSW